MNIFLVSLGCDKNLVDSEKILGHIHDNGYEITMDESQADIIIINTCCFIHDAKQESVDTILEYAEYKTHGKLKSLIVVGCLAERYKNEIMKEIPEVDALIGTSSFDKIIEIINNTIKGEKASHFTKLDKLPLVNEKRVLNFGNFYAYLKIAEGCDKHCTYCVIPQVRGNYRSVPMDLLIKEAKALAAQGIKELILVAQETTLYGVDLYNKKALTELLRQLCKIEGISWIRILYAYPEEITSDLIQVIKEEPKIRKYLDIPIQHASDRILKLMGRMTSKNDIKNIIKELRKNIPDIALRTSLIAGFPTETEQEHKELMDFVESMKFERLGVFTYSKEENTPAATLKPQVHGNTKKRRQREIMELQQDIAFSRNEELVGMTTEVLIEGKVSQEDVYIGRTYMDAPLVDGYIFINSDKDLLSGDIIKAKSIKGEGYDLIGEIDE